MLVVGITGFFFFISLELKSLNADLDRTQTIQSEVGIGKDLQLHVANIWQFITDASLTRDKKSLSDEAKPNLDAAYQNIDKLIELSGNDADLSGKLATIKKDLQEMWEIGNTMVDAYSVKWEKGNVVMKDFDKYADRIIASTASVVQDLNSKNDKAAQDIQGSVGRIKTRTTMTVIGIIAIGAGLTIFMLIMKVSITVPLSRFSEH